MPWISDFLSSGNKTCEIFSEDEQLTLTTYEQASKFFGGVLLEKSEHLHYLPFVLCSSFPNVNLKGRSFSPKVLSKSFMSLNGQLVDMEHVMADNDIGAVDDWILGYVKAMRFDVPKKMKLPDTKDLASFTTPLPVHGLSALFDRALGVKVIVDDYLNKKQPWKVSMECEHLWKDAAFFYKGEVIPLLDAPKKMWECITSNSVEDYKGEPVSVLLGEMAGRIDFTGVALTQMPADQTAHAVSIIAAQPRDTANKKLFMPMKSYNIREVATARKIISSGNKISADDIEKTNDSLIQELSNIVVIGKTEPAIEDGHTHDILSDLTIVPLLGHSHSFRSFNISTGKSGLLSGVTDTSYRYNDETQKPPIHLHLVSIPLQGIVSNDSGDDILEVSSMKKEISELKKKLAAATSLLTKKGDESEEKANLLSVTATLTEVMDELASQQSEVKTKEMIDTAINERIKAGDLLTKDVATANTEAAVTAKVTELQAEFTKKETAAAQQATRDGILIQNKIALTDVIPGLKGEGDKPVTVKDRLDAIPIENASAFNMEVQILKGLLGKKAADPNAKPAPAANDIAGGGPPATGSETASTTEKKPAPSHLRGRSIFTKAS